MISTTSGALILCGGRSSRMGTAKETVVLCDGRTMLEWVCSALEPLGLQIHLSTAATPASSLVRTGHTIIADETPFEGPLVAITLALERSGCGGLLVVCCDQPMLQSGSFAMLLPQGVDARPAHFVSDDGRNLAPFPGYFPAQCLGSLRRAVDSGERSPRRWLASQNPRRVSLKHSLVETLASLDSPEAIRAAGLSK